MPGARLNLRLVDAFADAVGRLVARPKPAVDALETLLEGWAAWSPAACDPRTP